MIRPHLVPLVVGWMMCTAAVLIPDDVMTGKDQALFLSLPGVALCILGLFWQQRDYRQRRQKLAAAMAKEEREFSELLRRLREEGDDLDG